MASRHIGFLVISICSVFILSIMIGEISIGYREAYGFFYSNSLVFELSRLSTHFFGVNNYGAKVPFLIFHFLNMLLIYLICTKYLKKPNDALLGVLIYALLPGVNITAILISKSVVIVFITLLICYLHLIKNRLFYVVSTIGLFLDSSFSIVFLALFFYSLKNKDNKMLVFSLAGFWVNMYIFGLDVGGVPRTDFLETIGQLSALYSPLLFIYYIYALYNSITKNQQTLMDYTSVVAISFILLLSIRQDIDLHTFVPVSIVGIPIMVKKFLSDARLRIKPFRRSYINRFIAVFVVLLIELGVLFGNKLLYLIDSKDHFLKEHYIAKELSNELKKANIYSIKSDNKLSLRLRFYGISNNEKLQLRQTKNKGDINIYYVGKRVASFNILKTK